MTIRITWKRVIFVLLGFGIAGLLFAWSGVMQISASSGHWRVTDWFLHWVMRNSVRTYAFVQAPEEIRDDDGMVSAAGHYRQACQVCHGGPGVRPSPVMQRATPPAPDLAHTAGEWRDRELFWIIRHGIKYTGMPAWAASDRPDEVRRMVTFVRRLPEMTPQDYRDLTQVRSDAVVPGVRPETLAACTGCHGSDGGGRGQGDIPVLGGQHVNYLRASMQRYASGERSSAVMQTAVASISPQEMDRLARHFAAMPGIDGDMVRTAQQPVVRDKAGQALPACANCHGAGKAAPNLHGQKASYIAQRLRAWQAASGIVDARQSFETMAVIARRIPADQIEPLARSLEAGADCAKDAGNGQGRCVDAAKRAPSP